MIFEEKCVENIAFILQIYNQIVTNHENINYFPYFSHKLISNLEYYVDSKSQKRLDFIRSLFRDNYELRSVQFKFKEIIASLII